MGSSGGVWGPSQPDFVLVGGCARLYEIKQSLSSSLSEAPVPWGAEGRELEIPMGGGACTAHEVQPHLCRCILPESAGPGRIHGGAKVQVRIHWAPLTFCLGFTGLTELPFLCPHPQIFQKHLIGGSPIGVRLSGWDYRII